MLGFPGQLELKERAARGEIVAPNLYLAGPSFSGNSIDSPEQAASRAREQAAEEERGEREAESQGDGVRVFRARLCPARSTSLPSKRFPSSAMRASLSAAVSSYPLWLCHF
ncbi:MAG: hypothetical protein ABR527_04125 [Gemmatimonadota bacterium]